ncbi:MAG: GFA family protein [Neomegalonema sp.]|nr:GFA family protein [Neomegalonema sp.]
MTDENSGAARYAGRCLCKKIRYEVSAPPLWTGYCHCESCRRATGSPVTAFLGVADGAWRWVGAQPRIFASTPGVRRSFCPDCGTPMSFAADRWPGETHFYIATLDAPALIAPQKHFHHDERLAWLHLADDLPKE